MLWFVLLTIALVTSGTELPLQCTNEPRVEDAIATLATQSDYDRPFSILATDPPVAACHLIRSLRTVRDTHVIGYEQDKHVDTMRVIWALRALRYLTDCQDFRAPTAENPDKWDGLRREWLLRDDTGVPMTNWKPSDGVRFFATWMSRDSLFIAPSDAQQGIITQWVEWYRTKGSHGFQFKTCESVNQWYF